MGSMLHFFFHNAADLPEQLTYGREDVYLQHFSDRLSHRPYFLTSDERQTYYDCFRRAGRMRAGFEVYRRFVLFRKDDKDVKDEIAQNGKLTLPILTMSGAHSVFVEHIHGISKELAYLPDSVAFTSTIDAWHWIPEENPQALVEESVRFLQR